MKRIINYFKRIDDGFREACRDSPKGGLITKIVLVSIISFTYLIIFFFLSTSEGASMGESSDLALAVNIPSFFPSDYKVGDIVSYRYDYEFRELNQEFKDYFFDDCSYSPFNIRLCSSVRENYTEEDYIAINNHWHNPHRIIVHRIVVAYPNDTFITQGDNNYYPDPFYVKKEEIIAKVILWTQEI